MPVRDPKVERDIASERAWLDRVLNDLMGSRFFGTIEIKFQAGRPVRLDQTKTQLPPTHVR